MTTQRPVQHTINVCRWCGNTFQAKRLDARFCTPNCRKRWSRYGQRAVRMAREVEQRLDWLHDARAYIGDDQINALLREAQSRLQNLPGEHTHRTGR